jgi:hypothetical protein
MEIIVDGCNGLSAHWGSPAWGASAAFHQARLLAHATGQGLTYLTTSNASTMLNVGTRRIGYISPTEFEMQAKLARADVNETRCRPVQFLKWNLRLRIC